MSGWRPDKDPPKDYLDLLYDEDHLYFSEEEEEEEEDISDVESEEDQYGTSPVRSRSPVAFLSTSAAQPGEEVVVQFVDENGVPLMDWETLPLDITIGANDISAPDAHLLFVSPEEECDRERRNRDNTSGRRGGRRGVRGVRGQGTRGQSARGGGHRGRRVRHEWEMGHPLHEIYMNDDDVPSELKDMILDVVSRRQARVESTARAARGNAERENDCEGEHEEFFDADDGGDSLPSLETNFEWSPMDSFRGQEEVFKPEQTGSVRDFNSAYDAFRSYWSDDILGLIVDETNKFAEKISSADFQSQWFPTNAHEILCLFSFWMMLGILRMPTIASCFSVDPLLKTEVFQTIFTRRRFMMLCRALHFIDPATNNPNSSTVNDRSSDRLCRLRPIIDHLNSAFQANYVLDKNISIDESLTLWKGRLNIKQYIRSKASKWGIKTFELCESATGYLWSFIVYTGKHLSTDLEQSPGVLQSTAVVKKLIRPLLNKGYRLFMDNWYNSPLLARFLKRNGTDCVGTLRPSRQNVPVLINKAPLKRGEYIARHSGDVAVLAWQDKKRITMISTCHGSSVALPTVSSRQPSRPVPFKPHVVLDYNKFMGGVDLKDQMLEPYLVERKRCRKWYMKLFKRLLNVSILNSRTLLQSSQNKCQDHLAFRLSLVDSILINHLAHCPSNRKFTISAHTSRSSSSQPNRYVLSAHWPIFIREPPQDASSSRKATFQKRCVVCLEEGRKNIKTSYCCEFCRVPLCVKDCFKSYHTQKSS